MGKVLQKASRGLGGQWSLPYSLDEWCYPGTSASRYTDVWIQIFLQFQRWVCFHVCDIVWYAVLSNLSWFPWLWNHVKTLIIFLVMCTAILEFLRKYIWMLDDGHHSVDIETPWYFSVTGNSCVYKSTTTNVWNMFYLTFLLYNHIINIYLHILY